MRSDREQYSPGPTIEDVFNVGSSPPDRISAWGDTMEMKSNRTLRVYFQNINGIPSHDQWAEWNHIVSYLKSKQIDVTGLAETNLKWTKQQTATAKRYLTAQMMPATLLTTACDEPTLYNYQRGGGTHVHYRKTYWTHRGNRTRSLEFGQMGLLEVSWQRW